MTDTAAAVVFVIYTSVNGFPQALPHSHEFNNQTGCQIYIHTIFGDELVEGFKITCAKK